MKLTARQQAARKRLRRANLHNQLALFEPSPPFSALLNETASRVLIRAANRVGKTRHLAFILASRLVNRPGYRARAVGPTSTQTQTVFGAYLYEFLRGHLSPKSYFTEGQGWNGGRARVILLANGSWCQLCSLEDDPGAHAGSSLDFVALDEPPKAAHLQENQSRVMDRKGAQIWIAATMVNRPVGYLRTLVEGQDDSPTSGRTMHSSGWCQHVVKFRRENVPWYDDETVENWLAANRASPWQWSQRIDGAWLGVTVERQFSAFTEDNVTNEGWHGRASLALAYDHGEVAQSQVTLLAAWQGDCIWIIDERVAEATSTPEEVAHETVRMLSFHKYHPKQLDYAVGDINRAGRGFAGWKMNEAIEKSIARSMGRQHCPFRIQIPDKGSGSVEWGLRVINFASKRGQLRVHPRCKTLLESLRHWKGGKTPRSDDNELSHAADALRYLVIGTLGQVDAYARLRFD